MAKTLKPAEDVKAWAFVDKNGTILPYTCSVLRPDPKATMSQWILQNGGRAVRVTIALSRKQ